MESLAIERSIWINASCERVWEALTDPAQMQQWFAPNMTFKSTGSEVGARIYIEDPETGGELYPQVIAQYEPPHRFMSRTIGAPDEPTFSTKYLLEPENNGTRLTLHYTSYETMPAADRASLREENAAGFELMLQNIKAFIEGTPLVRPEGF